MQPSAFTLFTRIALSCLALAVSAPAFADPSDQPPATPHEPCDHKPHKPPTAAYDACKELEEGAECQATFGEHNVDGTCSPDREDGSLFCRPNHPPPRPEH